MTPVEDFDALQAEAMKKGTVAVGQSGDHHVDGVIIASGGPIRKGVSVSAHIFDVTPTILALMGLPVPDDMAGRVLTEMIEPAFLRQYPIVRISSYEDYIDRPRLEIGERLAEEEMVERLRSLGYIK